MEDPAPFLLHHPPQLIASPGPHTSSEAFGHSSLWHPIPAPPAPGLLWYSLSLWQMQCDLWNSGGGGGGAVLGADRDHGRAAVAAR